MPYGAFAPTVTAPPVAPLLSFGLSGVLVGDGAGELLALAAMAADEPIDAGTEVASVPSRTSTWPAGTVALGLAVNPMKYPAIFCALAAAPAPYSTSVDDCVGMSPTVPALNPAEVSAWDMSAASPAEIGRAHV